MQSKEPSAYYRRAQARRGRDLAINAGLCVFLCLSSVFIGACFVAFYRLMQPVIYPNMEVAAQRSTALALPQYDTDSPAEISFAAKRAPGGKTALAAIGPAEKPSGEATQEDTSKAKKSEAAKRKRPAQPKRRDPKMSYAAQPGFSDYRPWGSYQSWSEYRPSGNYQASGGYRPRYSYQGGNYRNGH
jgi:hypothetical protein